MVSIGGITPGADGGLRPDELQSLAPLGAHVLDNASAIIQTVFGKEADVGGVNIGSIAAGEIDTMPAGEYLMVDVSLEAAGESWSCYTLLKPEEVSAAFDLGTPAEDGDWTDQAEKLINPVELLVDALNAQLGPQGLAGAAFARPGVRSVSLPDDVGIFLLAPEESLVEITYYLSVSGAGQLSAITLVPTLMAKRLARSAGGSPTGLSNDPLGAMGDLLSTPTIGRTPVDMLDDIPPLPENATGGMEMASNAPSFGGAQPQRRVQPAEGGVVRPVQFQAFGDGGEGEPVANIDLILDVSLRLTVELGRTSKTIREILELGPGVVVELDKLAGEPVDILVNDKPIAKGEVVVMDENFAVRVVDIISPQRRVASLR